MYKNGQHVSAISNQAFENHRPLASFYKKTSIIVSFAIACTILALGTVTTDNITVKLNVLSARLTSASDSSNRIHKAERLSTSSFEERWSAVPTPSSVVNGDRDRREAPRAEKRERIPFSCELAFSRLVTKGNFSTRCIAGLETSKTNT
jgi:hypothetical protein